MNGKKGEGHVWQRGVWVVVVSGTQCNRLAHPLSWVAAPPSSMGILAPPLDRDTCCVEGHISHVESCALQQKLLLFSTTPLE